MEDKRNKDKLKTEVTAKISIIMAVYNAENTLHVAIDSIVKQTYTNWNFIICDDCSTDSSLEILNEYKRKFPDKFIILRNEKNSKLAYSLNRCLKFAQGDYIARMDADDISTPERLQIQLDFLEKNTEFDLVGTAMSLFDEKGDRGLMTNKKVPNKFDLLNGAAFFHATILCRKKVFDILKGYIDIPRTIRVEDFDLWFRFFYFGFKGYNIEQPLYLVRVSINDLNRRTFDKRINAFKTALVGYRLLNFPIYKYIYAFKPIIAGVIPKKLMYLYHNYKFSKNNE